MTEYISREEAAHALMLRYVNDQSAVETIYAIPAADVAPIRHGTWVFREVLENGHRTFLSDRWYCSACGEYQTHGETMYCPHCGARMRDTE